MQYIHWNRRLYIHGGAVKRQDIFIWFITLFHLIHEQLALGDRGERTVLRPGLLEGKRSEVGGGEKQALSGVILTAGDAKYQSIPAGHNKGLPLQDHTLTIQRDRRERGEKRGIKLKQSWERVVSWDVLYNKLYIMLNPARFRSIEGNK